MISIRYLEHSKAATNAGKDGILSFVRQHPSTLTPPMAAMALAAIDQERKEEFFSESKTHFYLEKTSEILAGFIPSGAFEEVEEGVASLEKTSKTRKKLEEINLLKKDNGGGEQQQPAESPESSGYSDEMRQQMDQLFDEKTDGLNE